MPAGPPAAPGPAHGRPAAFATPGGLRLDASNYGLAAGIAPYQIGTSNTTGTASRVTTVTAVTDPGDGMLLIATCTAAGVTMPACSDSKGNTYTADGSFTTTLPYLFAFRCDGATGGPGGGPTAQLVPGDTITVTNNAVSTTINIAAWCVPGGPALDAVSAVVVGSAVTSLGVPVTPVTGGDLCVLGAVTQVAGGRPTFDLPYVYGSAYLPATGSYPSMAYQAARADSAGVAQTATIRTYGTGNIRAIQWAFKPLPLPPFPVIQAALPVHVTSLTGPVAISLPNPTAAGNTVVVCASTNGSTGNPTVSGITLGALADNWAKAVQLNSATRNDAEIWYDPGAAVGQTQISVTFAGGSGTGDLFIEAYEVGGILAVDQVVTGEGGPATTWSSGATPSTTQAAEIAFGVVISTGSRVAAVTGAGNWATIPISANTYTQVSGWQEFTSAGPVTYSGTLPVAANITTAVATFGAPTTQAAQADAAGAAESLSVAVSTPLADAAGAADAPSVVQGAPPYLAGTGLTTGSVTSRTAAVTTATGTGDTLLALITTQNTSCTISNLTDSQGNVYTLDSSFQVAVPMTYFYRSPGATGGPGGGPTVALGTSDTLTATSAAVTGNVEILLVGVPGAGALDLAQTANGVSAAPGRTFTPREDNATCVAMVASANAGGQPVITAPYALVTSYHTGVNPWNTAAWEQLGAGTNGVLQTFAATITSAQWYALNYVFAPYVPPVLVADQAGAAEALSVAVTAAVPQADAAGAAEVAVVAAAAPAADRAAAVEAVSITAAMPVADAAGAAESLSVIMGMPPVADAAGAAEALSVVINLPAVTDAAGAAETLAVSVTVPLAEAAGGADAVSAAPLATVLPRCYRAGNSGTANSPSLAPSFTAMTNAGAGIAGTAPQPGDLVVFIGQMHLANLTVSQTADLNNNWTFLSAGDNNGAAIGMSSFVACRWWTGGESGAVFTLSTAARDAYSIVAYAPAVAGQYISIDFASAVTKDNASTTHTPPAGTATGSGELSLVLFCATGFSAGTSPLTYANGAWTIVGPTNSTGDGTSGPTAQSLGVVQGYSSGQGPGTITPDPWTIQGSNGPTGATNTNIYHLVLTAGVVPPVTLINRLDAGVPGTAITPANSGDVNNAAFDVVTINGSGNSLTYDNTAAAFSPQSAKFVLGATVSAGYFMEWGTQLGGPAANKKLWFRFYYLTPALPSANLRIFQLNQQADYAGGGNYAIFVRINTAGKWVILDAAGATAYTSAATVPTNTWIRVEGTVIGDPANGGIQVSVYPSALPAAAPETFTALTGQNTGGPMGFIHYGGGTTGSNASFSVDEAGVSNTGPLGAVVPAFDAAAAAETFAVSKVLFPADAAGAAEQLAIPAQGIFPADAAGATESLGVGIPLGDTAGAAESLSVSVTAVLADRAGAADAPTVAAAVQVADVGASTDANVARLPAITITATEGGSTGAGLLMHVIAYAVGTAYPGRSTVSGGAGVTTATQCNVTPRSIGGVLNAITAAEGSSTPTLSVIGGTVQLEQFPIAASHTIFGACYDSAATAAEVAQAIGFTNTLSTGTCIAAGEVQPGVLGVPVIDSQSFTDAATGTVLNSGSVLPPAGGLIWVMVAAQGGVGQATMALSDSSGLTWTAMALAEPTGANVAGIFWARVPGDIPPTNTPADAAGAAEQLTVAAGIPEPDVAAAADALSVFVSGSAPALPDAAGAADAVAISAAVPETDAAGATEALAVAKNIPVALADAAAAADACGMNMPVALADQAASTEAPSAGKMQLVQDAFPGTTLNTVLWNSFGTISISGNIISVSDTTGSSNYSGFQTNLRWDLTASYILAQLVNAGTQAATTQSLLMVSLDASNAAQIFVQNGNLSCQHQVAGAWTVLATVAYSSVNHKWLRLRESGGTLYYEYSASGSAWTALYSEAAPFTLTSLIAAIEQGQYGGTDPATTSQWANVNTAPTGSPSSADAAANLDSITVAAALPAAPDRAAAADALAVLIAPPGQADAAGAAESLAVTVTVPLADPAGAADALARAIAVAPADAAGAAEALAGAAAVPLPEAAGATEAMAITVQQVEAAGAVERLNLGMTPADAAGAAETLAYVQQTALPEAAGAAEALAVSATAAMADAAGAADAFAVSLGTPTSEPDVAAAADAISHVVTGLSPQLAESAGGTEKLTITVTVPLAERAGAAEVCSTGVAGFPNPGDAAGAAETLLVAVTTQASDTAASTEALPAQVTLALPDQGGAADQAAHIAALIYGWAEYAAARDVLRSPAAVPLPERAGAADQLAVAKQYLPLLAEAAGAAERLTVVIGLAKTAADQAGAAEALAVPARTVHPADQAAAAERIALPAKTLPVADAAAGTERLVRASVYFGACHIVARASVYAAGSRVPLADVLWEAYIAAAQKAIDIESNIEEDLIAGGKGTKYGTDYAALYEAQLAAFDAYHAYEDAKEAVPYGSVKLV